MKLRITHVLGALSFFFVSRGFSQALLTEAQVTGGFGAPSIASSIQPQVGIAATVHSPRVYLFEGLSVQPGDVGHTYIVGPADDADFASFTTLLTDGYESAFSWLVAGSETTGPEVSFFPVLPSGNNGVDLGGFQINYFALRFDSLELLSPGGNPNGDGIWTDGHYTATLSVYGQPVPELTSAALLGLGIFALCAKVKWLTRRGNERRRAGAVAIGAPGGRGR